MGDDVVHHRPEVSVDVRIPITPHAKPLLKEDRIAMTISLGPIWETMLSTVDLDNEPMLQAGEVDDISSNRHLTAKMKPGRAQGAQCDPEFRLLRGHALAQGTRDAERNG
jgi:hypothetical protein